MDLDALAPVLALGFPGAEELARAVEARSQARAPARPPCAKHAGTIAAVRLVPPAARRKSAKRKEQLPDDAKQCQGKTASGERCKVWSHYAYASAETVGATGFCTFHIDQRSEEEEEE